MHGYTSVLGVDTVTDIGIGIPDIDRDIDILTELDKQISRQIHR